MNNLNDIGTDEDFEPVGLGCALERFVEWQEILEMIKNLKMKEDQADYEKNYEKYKYIINLYKEQPHLIDSHLSEILDEIINIVKDENIDMIVKHRAFKYMHLTTNVRGYKIIVRHLPHSASDFDPVLQMIENQDKNDTSIWETRYCLLLWLSIVVKIPFHMSRLDYIDENNPSQKTVMERVFNICKEYLMVGDLSRQAAAFLSAHFLSRSDVKEKYLSQFFDWACQCVKRKELNWGRLGPLSGIAAILKHGKRDDLLTYAPRLLGEILSMNWKSEGYRLIRKITIKIIQRIGLTFLKAKVITWRYQRGGRFLDLNFSSGEHKAMTEDTETEKEEDTEYEDVPSELNDVFEELMQGLRDPDLTVRWSAAKGIGRIMGRISKQLGDEVVCCVIELLSARESENAWHGGCLALAELSRRGLLLPSRLPEVIPLIKKALVYDEPRGVFSVGSIVRDAACYVCWAFARAYDSELFKPYISDIANALVIVSCFDREVNIRRAASAAFQEHIGRQGTFPHGIEILTTADYFSVGVRTNTYLNISAYIAQFEEYTISLIDHLVERKVIHWDIAIRELTAKALHNLTPRAPKYVVENVLPNLIRKTSDLDINVRHGAIMAIGEILHALSKLGIDIGPDTVITIRDLIPLFRMRHQLRGLTGELMKIACCHLIYKCSLARLPFHDHSIIDDWQTLIDECISHEVNNVRTCAATALSALSLEYYQKNGVANKVKCQIVVHAYIEKLKTNDETIRSGFAVALGSLPAMMLIGSVEEVIHGLIQIAHVTPATEKWVESRKNSIKAITSICVTTGIKNKDPKLSCRPLVNDIVECMIEGLQDYTLDDRGDTGAWVRESSMSGLQTIILMVTKESPDLLNERVITQSICNIIQQAVERIDRTRALAGTVFSSLIHSCPPVPHIPQKSEVLSIFTEEVCKNEIDWLSHNSFPKFTEMLSLKTYTRSLLNGFIASVGGLTESLVKSSSSSLFAYFNIQPADELNRICDIITDIYESNVNVERVILQMLKFLELLLSSGSIQKILENPNSDFSIKILNLTKTATFGTSHKYKLLGSVDVYCQLIQVKSSVSRKALQRIFILICHRFGWLRKATATRLYESLMIYGEDLGCSEEALEKAQTILSDTEWGELTQNDLRPIRNKLSQLFNVPPPEVVSKKV